MNSVSATIIAIISGLGAIVTAVGGVLLAIRTVRSRERTAAKHELDQVIEELTYVEALLDWERAGRVDAETYNHDLLVILRHEGIGEPPVPAPRPPRPSRPAQLSDEDEEDRDADQPGAGGAEDPAGRVPGGGDPGGNVRDIRDRSSGDGSGEHAS
jgi:hypothetical protein